jgi:hypothetical protein
MAFPVKFLSLQKAELEYEVEIRGSTPAANVSDLRKQIAKLGPQFPSEDILISPFPVEADIAGISDVLMKVKANLDTSSDSNVLLRTQNLLNHLHHRFNRISVDEKTMHMVDSRVSEYLLLRERCDTMKDKGVHILAPGHTSDIATATALPVNVTVQCDRGGLSDLARLKFDGKSCVRAFVQRITEFREARGITGPKLLSYATEIFVGDALHWYRSIRDQVADWDALVSLLKKDFDQSDYDYRLLSEIRSRTQGEAENITIYLSIMSGLFSRLSKPLSQEDRLEILLHNIRPCYASTLASVTTINDVDTLRTLCRNFENIQARLAKFKEPPRQSQDTLAPEFAYNSSSNNKFSYSKNSYNLNHNNNNQQSKYTGYNNTNYNNRSYATNYTNKNKYQPNSNQPQLHAIQGNNAKNYYCPRCRVNTHNLRQCTANKDEIRCFVCGLPNVKTPDCPKCGKNRPSSSKN